MTQYPNEKDGWVYPTQNPCTSRGPFQGYDAPPDYVSPPGYEVVLAPPSDAVASSSSSSAQEGNSIMMSLGSFFGNKGAPPMWNRPAAVHLPYNTFPPMWLISNGKELSQGFPELPPPCQTSPHPFLTHDVTEEDWKWFLADVKKAGSLSPAQRIRSNVIPMVTGMSLVTGLISTLAMEKRMKYKNRSAAGDLVDHWNHYFFGPRRMEVVLQQGSDRLNGHGEHDEHSSSDDDRRHRDKRAAKRERREARRARKRGDFYYQLDTSIVAPPLRIFATGAVFFTHALVLPAHPRPGSVSRAQSVYTSRGGTAAHVLALLAQLASTAQEHGPVEPLLIASLGGNPDALRLREALESAGVRTKYCKIWPGLGVPSAWVVHARDTDSRTVINHNPLPEVSHDDFIALLGPLLAPENYVGFTLPLQQQTAQPIPREQQSPSPVSMFPNTFAPSAPRPSMSSRPNTAPSPSNTSPFPGIPSQSPHSPAPFDWLHLEGRSVRTTIANLVGVDGLARERKWRSHCVISIDLGRRARDSVQVLIPHADVIFLTTTTFASPSSPGHPSTPTTPTSSTAPTPSPRAILLSLARHAPPHALLVLDAGRDGAALLSLPTSEYLQTSGWTQLVATRPGMHRPVTRHSGGHTYSVSSATTSSNGTFGTCGAYGERPSRWDSVESVRSGSDFWAGGTRADTSFASQVSMNGNGAARTEARPRPSGESFHPMDSDDEDEQGQAHEQRQVQVQEQRGEDGRQTPQPEDHVREVEESLDEEGAHAAFVAGMIWALSRRILPGSPYVPGIAGQDGEAKSKDGIVDTGLRWRLDECLRFATELACRKAYIRPDDVGVSSMATSSGAKERTEWDGLGDAMRIAGWFD